MKTVDLRDVKIATRNFHLGKRMEGLIARKVGQLLSHLPAAEGAKVDIVFEPTRPGQERYLVKLLVSAKGTAFRTERRAPSALAALHAAADAMDKLEGRFKARVYRSQRTRQQGSLGLVQAEETMEWDRELAQELQHEEASLL